MKLKDRVAIVTGGGRGIGRAIAEAFGARGGQGRRHGGPGEARDRGGRREIGGTAVLADVSNRDAVQRLVDAVLSQFGRIDILVNNAARGMKFVNASFMTDPMPFWEADPDAWRMVIDTNVNGVFLMTRAVIPHMLARRSGRIINISINRETMRRKGFTPYGPSKAALESMNEIWAQDWRARGSP